MDHTYVLKLSLVFWPKSCLVIAAWCFCTPYQPKQYHRVRNDINVNLGEKDGIQNDSYFVHGLKKTVSWLGRKPSDGSQKREEYHLTAKDGNHQSQTMLLNGSPLQLTYDGGIPALNPAYVSVNSSIKMAPMSIAFVVFPKFEARACA